MKDYQLLNEDSVQFSTSPKFSVISKSGSGEARFSPRTPGYNPKWLHMRYVVDAVTLEKVFLSVSSVFLP
jgi:hypothetical protein